MKIHIRLAIFAVSTWAGFLILGLPDYYQQYSGTLMVVFSTLLLVPISAALYYILRRIRPARRQAAAVRIALHFTFPLAIYDYLYCGVYLKHGIGFVFDFWYLSVFYFIPWVLAPSIAMLLNNSPSFRATPNTRV